ncbi:MAG: PAS domain-containing sensor histidine kinase [Granulosicoccus sp.]
MTAKQAEPRYSPVAEPVHAPDWPALRMVNQYRLLILLALAAIYYLSEDQRTLGSRSGDLFEIVHLAYVVATLGFVYLIRLRKPTVHIQFFVQNYLDILLIGGLMYASGGVQSGLGPLLLINLALLSQLTSLRHALLFASIASTVVIGEELLAKLLINGDAANFEATALLGSQLFVIAWIMTVPLRKLMQRQMARSTHSRAVLDVEQIANLNEEIIRELDSGVVVIDNAHNVQLINDTARALLAAEFLSMPVHMKRLCRELMLNLRAFELSPSQESRPFEIISSGVSVLPNYIPLSNGGMLIRLDDHAHIKQQFQQLKLASLGRLSASIAHEIRNPLGAISHAVQLMQESSTLDPKDAELLKIAKRHTSRINRIVEDVLQLSNHQQVRTELLNIDEIIITFAERFRSEHDLNSEQLNVFTEHALGVVDPGHLDQVLWNLCTNAQLHNQAKDISITISCWQAQRGLTIVDVIDNGRGISDIERENLFEPFYSTHHAGTGLGLFIIRQLCELNKAQIECISRDAGAHFRITLSTSQDMAA